MTIKENNNMDEIMEQLFLEAAFDDNWLKKNQIQIEKINKAVETGDEKFLDRVFRILCSNGVIIGICTAVGSGGNPVLMPAAALGAIIGSTIGGLVGEEVFDRKGINRVMGYQNMIKTNINAIEANINRLDSTKDSDKIKNLNIVLKSLKKADKLCTNKLHSLNEYYLTPVERVQYIFENTKLV